MRKILLMMCVLFLSACGTSGNVTVDEDPNNVKDEPMYEGVNGFIVSKGQGSILVIGSGDSPGATSYSFDERTIIEAEDGSVLVMDDLKLGQFVKTYNEALLESYPSQGRALKLIIMEKDDLPPAKGIANALERIKNDTGMPYLYAYEKEEEGWKLDFKLLNADETGTYSFLITKDGEIID